MSSTAGLTDDPILDDAYVPLKEAVVQRGAMFACISATDMTDAAEMVRYLLSDDDRARLRAMRPGGEA